MSETPGTSFTKLEAIGVKEEDMMVSFDVVSLFPRVPVSEALRVIEDLIADDDTLETWTAPLPAS